MKQLINITKLRKALKRFWNIHFVMRSYSSKIESTEQIKPKGCTDDNYPNGCKRAGCLYCEKFNTFKATL